MANGDDDMLDRIPQRTPWKNWHETVTGPIRGVYNIWYPSDGPAYGSASINRCTVQLQKAVAQAKAEGAPVRVVGRGWSLSEAALVRDGWMIDMTRLNGMKPLRGDQIDPGYIGDAAEPNRLWMIQGGAYLSEINQTIERDGFERSLHTSGAANGQTIVGATATGTHGSRLGFPALHDTVVALHLLAGDSRQYWIERASYPVLKPSLPARLGATMLRDDDLFNAAVLGLGAFGIIHNVVIETRPRIYLRAENFDDDGQGGRLTLDTAMRDVIRTLDFDAHPRLRDPGGRQPYFFQPIIDPNSNPPQVLVTLMYEEPWPAGYQPNYGLKESKFGPGYDFLSTAGALLDIFQPAVPLFAQIARAELFEKGTQHGSWGELFGYKAHRTKAASGTVAVGHADGLAALDALFELNADIGPAPLAFGCRFVAKSQALLAMNRFDTTMVIGLDGVWNHETRAFFDAIPAKMEAAGITFTQHWGKSNAWTQARVQAVYGANYDTWIEARHQLLPDPADRAAFTNDYMRERGLDA